MAAKRICSIPDCGKPHKGYGYCRNHLDRIKRNGHPNLLRVPTLVCTIPNCDKPHLALGLCSMHYDRRRKHGDPLFTKTAPTGEPAKFLADFLKSPPDTDDCVHWPYSRSSGYGNIHKSGAVMYVHRIVCEHFHGKPPTPSHIAAHSCGNGHQGCIHPNHLRWATMKENQADRVQHGTMIVGDKNPNAKLSEADIPTIRAMSETMTSPMIAHRYNVSPRTIRDVLHGASWKHV